MKAENKLILYFAIAIWFFFCLSTLTTFLLEIDFFKRTTVYNEEKCVRVKSSPLENSEDQTKFNNNSILMTEWSILKHKPGEDRPGAMYVASGFRHSDETPDAQKFVDNHLNIEKLPLVGFPEGVDFHPHGIYIHKPDNTLYVVNHAYEKGGERIEVFDIITTDSDDADNVVPNKLNYKYSITDEWMKTEMDGILNSLVVVEPNKFYVTQYEAHPKDRDAPDYVTDLHMLHLLFSKPKETRVWYCEYNPSAASLDCKTAAEGFVVANGITSNQDHSKIFVADTVGRSITIFDRDASTNELTNRITVMSPFVTPDNIKFDDVSGKVYGAGVSHVFQTFKNFAMNPNEESEESTSGLIELSYSSNRGRRETHFKGWAVTNPLATSKLNMATNGIRMNSHYVMGSGVGAGTNHGVLVCPLVEEEKEKAAAEPSSKEKEGVSVEKEKENVSVETENEL